MLKMINSRNVYYPSLDSFDNYVDKCPLTIEIGNGIYCSCGSRPDHKYTTYQLFKKHLSTCDQHIAYVERKNDKHQIKKLNLQLQELRHELNLTKHKVVEKNNIITDLRNEIAEKDDINTELKNENLQKNGVITYLIQENANNTQKIKTLEELIDI